MSKVKLIIGGVVISLLLLLFGLWRYEVVNNNKLTKENTELSSQNNLLVNENQKLSEYIKNKDEQIDKINKEYLELINNIPSDKCGDAYPSNELLEYYKSGVIK